MKKVLPYIFKTTFALALSLTPLAMARAFSFWDLVEGSLYGALIWIGKVILDLCISLLVLAGKAFDYAVVNSITGQDMLAQSGVVEAGWTIARDLANIFFIFILIFIGIATILQISGYGYKQLLLKVIIIALLINFSLFFGQTIIKASNVLAMEFYSKLVPQGGEGKISTALSQGLQLQTIFGNKQGGNEALDALQTEGNEGKILLVIVFGSGLMLVSAFVLFAGAIMFILRNIALGVLLILAPLAFIGMILPKTQQYASQWWDQIIKQSFFAPAFLFMFYLVVKTINTESYKQEYSDGQAYVSLLANLGEAGTGNIAIIISFTTLIMLMLGCLTVAKIMGGKTAEMGIAGAKWTKGRMTGYAGRMGGATGRFAARQTAARAGEKISESPKMEKFAAAHPRFGGWTMEKAKQIAGVGGRKEQIEKQVRRGMSLPAEQRAAYLTNLAKGPLADRQAQKEMFKHMPDRERVELLKKAPKGFKETYDQLLATLPVEAREKTQKLQKETERKWSVGDKISRLTNTEKPLTKEETKGMLQEINIKEFKDITDKGGMAAEAFFDKVKELSKNQTNTEIAEVLRKMGNKSLASVFHAGPNAPILKAYGIKFAGKEKTGDETKKEAPKIIPGTETEYKKATGQS